MDKYNAILQDVLESNRLKHLIMLDITQVEALEKLQITNQIFVESESHFYLYLRVTFCFDNEYKFEAKLQKDYLKNNPASSTTVQLISDGILVPFDSRISMFFPDLDNEINTKDVKVNLIMELLNEVFNQILNTKVKTNGKQGAQIWNNTIKC